MKWRPLTEPPPVELEHVLISIQEHLDGFGTPVEAKVMEAFCRYNLSSSKQKVAWFKQDGSGLGNDQWVNGWQPLPKAFK
jgi:hypothetical protein